MPYLRARDAEETHRHEHTRDRDLVIAELDAVQILYAQTVRRDQAVQSEDLVHLNSGNERAAALSDDMRD